MEVNDDAPTISFGTRLKNGDEEEVPPFYLSLNVHDMVIHNVMPDLGASHTDPERGGGNFRVRGN